MISYRDQKIKYPKLESLEVRAELYKLFYLDNEFELNNKADAYEAFDHMVSLIHAWCRSIG